MSAIWKYLHDDFLIVPKALYFGLNLVIYTVHAYQAKFLMDTWGIPIEQYGYISSLQCFDFLGAIVWSNVTDKVGRPKTLISLCAIMYCALMCCILIPVFKKDGQQLAFSIYVAAINGSAHFFLAGCFPLLDTMIMGLLSRTPRNSKEMFGRQRLWGTFGHAIATYLSMFAIKICGYTGMYWVLFLSTVFFVLCVIKGIPGNLESDFRTLRQHHHNHSRSEQQLIDKRQETIHSPSSTLENEHFVPTDGSPTLYLLKSPHFLFFLTFALVAGYVRSIMSNFQSFFLEDVLHQPKEFVANAGAVRVITEVAVFFFGKQLMSSIGPYWMLILSQAAGIARVFGYGQLPTEKPEKYRYFVFLLELLKGLNTGLIVTSAVRIANDIAPRDCVNTAQGLFSGVYVGLAMALSGIFGGLLIKIFKNQGYAQPMQAMFCVTAIIAIIMTILFILKYAIIDRVIFVSRHSHAQHPSSPSSQRL